MQTIWAILLLLLCGATPIPGWGQDTLLVSGDEDYLPILPHALIKPASSKEVPAINTTWLPLSKSIESIADPGLWLKTHIKNTQSSATWVHLKATCCFQMVAYLSRKSQTFHQLEAAPNNLKESESGYSYLKAIPILLQPDEIVTIIIHIQKIVNLGSQLKVKSQTDKSANLPEIHLYTHPGFLNYAYESVLSELPFIQIITLFQGAVGFSMVFFLFLYFKNKQKIYLFYSAYLVCFLVYALLLTRPYLPGGNWIAWMGWIKQPLQEGFNWLGLAMYIFFSASLLDMKRLEPKGYKWLRLLAFVILAYSIAVFTWIPINGNLQTLQQMFVVSRIIGLSLNLMILIWIYKKFNSPLKIYLIIGNSFIFITGTIASLITLGAGAGKLLNYGIGNSEAILIYLIGIILEVVTFSFALGHRIKINEEERDKSKEAYIQQLTLNQTLIQKTNLELEQKVQEHTARLTEQFNALEKEREEKLKSSFEKDLAHAQIQALHSQMNPHFLFNALNSIELAIQKGMKSEAIDYLSKFTRLLRLILQHTRSEKITLKEELQSVRLYLDLESWRFGEGFKYSIQLDENIEPESISIPPLLLQPFVENAIWHGLMHSEKKEKLLNIKVFNENNCLGFSIEDNGVGMKRSHIYNQKNSKTRKSLGIALVNDRVTLFNKHSHQQLEFQHLEKADSDASEGTIVRICLKNRDHD